MPLEILVTMVVCGVVAIAIILHMSGRSAVVPLTEDSATRAWLRHSPDSAVQSARPAATGHAALITTEQGMGIVWCFG
ncbi:MAG: hypothetical protein VXZ09_18700, partial [Pseudomonadota bacterium]|nr:hypothetical protein [Pseudomonadota bacterium]